MSGLSELAKHSAIRRATSYRIEKGKCIFICLKYTEAKSIYLPGDAFLPLYFHLLLKLVDQLLIHRLHRQRRVPVIRTHYHELNFCENSHIFKVSLNGNKYFT